MSDELKPSQTHPRKILEKKMISLKDIEDAKKKIERGIFWCLKFKIIDNPTAKEILNKMSSFVQEGIRIYDILFEIDGIIHDGRKMDAENGDPMKLMQRQFTASDLFEDPEFIKKLNQEIEESNKVEE